MSLDQPSNDMRRIADATEALVTNVDDLTKAHKVSKKRIRLLAFTVAFDIVLSLILGFVAYGTHKALDDARSASAKAHIVCEAKNEQALKTKGLWNYAFNLGADNPHTADEQAKIDDFKAYIDKTFALEDCNKI